MRVDELVEVLRRADAVDGWRCRPDVVGPLDDVIGRPLSERMAARGIANLQARHDHTGKADARAQFLFQERFALPTALHLPIENVLTKKSGKLTGGETAYLGFTLAHRRAAAVDREGAAHLRWGLVYESAPADHEKARPVFDGPRLRARLEANGVDRRVVLRARHQVPGFEALAFIGLVRVIEAEEAARLPNVEALVEAAASDLAGLHAAISR